MRPPSLPLPVLESVKDGWTDTADYTRWLPRVDLARPFVVSLLFVCVSHI